MNNSFIFLFLNSLGVIICVISSNPIFTNYLQASNKQNGVEEKQEITKFLDLNLLEKNSQGEDILGPKRKRREITNDIRTIIYVNNKRIQPNRRRQRRTTTTEVPDSFETERPTTRRRRVRRPTTQRHRSRRPVTRTTTKKPRRIRIVPQPYYPPPDYFYPPPMYDYNYGPPVYPYY